jgi:hypothetical protein
VKYKGIKQKIHCNNCGRNTNHDCLFRKTTVWDDDLGDGASIQGGDDYRMIQCCGCDFVSLYMESWFSEETDYGGTPITKVTRFPPAMPRRRPTWMSEYLRKSIGISEFLEEIYGAFQNGAYRLCALGIRALLEKIMIQKIGEHDSIGNNMKKFLEAGFVAEKYRKQFEEQLIGAGHAAMHRDYSPKLEDVSILLDITETIIEQIYIHPDKAAEMAKGIPARAQRKTKQQKP